MEGGRTIVVNENSYGDPPGGFDLRFDDEIEFHPQRYPLRCRPFPVFIPGKALARGRPEYGGL
jgi:hypothetical protein